MDANDDDDGHDADDSGHLQTTTGEADSLGSSNGRTPQLQLDVVDEEALAAQRRRRQLRRLDRAQYRPKASSIAAVMARSGIGSGKGGPTVSGLVSSVHVLTRARVEAERRRQARELTSYRQRARVWK